MLTLIKFSALVLALLIVLAGYSVSASNSNNNIQWQRKYKLLKPGKLNFKGAKKWNSPTTSSRLLARPPACVRSSTVYLGGSSTPPAIKPFDQGPLGSCVANVMAMAANIAFKKTGGENLDMSRMWLYKMGRRPCLQSGHSLKECTGSSSYGEVFDYIKKDGFLKESQWPYNGTVVETDRYANVPPMGLKMSQRVAKQNRDMYFGGNGIELFELTDILQVYEMIDDGIPVLIAYNGWDSIYKDGGQLDFSNVSSDPAGIHAVLAIGYSDFRCPPGPKDNGEHQFYFLNSWGPEYGDNGVGRIPQSFFMSKPLNSCGSNRAYAIRFTAGNRVL